MVTLGCHFVGVVFLNCLRGFEVPIVMVIGDNSLY